MNKRLEQFLKAENISQSQFADTIGVARANISHIIAGRNKPGFDFLQRMSKHYPSLNLEWLITGKGRMFNTKNLLFDQLEDSPAPSKPIVHESAPEIKIQEEKPIRQQISNSRTISKIIIFYDDGSYQEVK